MAEQIESGSFLTGSDQGFDIVCVPCNIVGNNLEAEGYCLDCGEHLCAACLKYHRTLSALRHHKLEDKYNMPKVQKGPLVKDICTERCPTHNDKVIEYFCPTHDILGCTVCVTLKHKLCEDVAYIPEVSSGLEQSQEYKNFKQKLNELIAKSSAIITSAKEKIKFSSDFYAEAYQDIISFRHEINATLDKLEAQIRENLELIYTNSTSRMEKLSRKAVGVQDDLRIVSEEFQELQSKKLYCQMFTKMKNTKCELVKLQSRLKEIGNIRCSFYKFSPRVKLLQMLKGGAGLGHILVRDPEERQAVHLTDINVRSKDNEYRCVIRGAALLSDKKLVVTDWRNDTIKLIDLNNNEIISELKPESYLWTVTTISKDKVAVTLPTAEKILLLQCENKLVVYKKVSVKGRCYGIAHYQDRLIVSFVGPPKIEILSMTGDVVQRFVKDDQGNKLFSDPRYISVHMEEPSIFVSDWDQNSLVKLSMDGKIHAVHKNTQLDFLCQCAIDQTGLIYLCGRKSHNVHQLTQECIKIKTVLTVKDRITSPLSICYCEEMDRLYVGMDGNDSIKIYQLNG